MKINVSVYLYERYTVLSRMRSGLIFKMSTRPKRSVNRLNWHYLANVIVPRTTRSTMANASISSESSTLYRLKIA